MRIDVVVVGRVRGPLAEGVREYEERATRYWKLQVAEVDAGVSGGKGRPEDVKAAEAERILARIPDGSEVVALTREGKGMSSPGLARWLGHLALHASAGACFVIGGAFGLHDTVLQASRRRLSLSPMTLPHELARLVLTEQLYRAGTILRNEPYHKGG